MYGRSQTAHLGTIALFFQVPEERGLSVEGAAAKKGKGRKGERKKKERNGVLEGIWAQGKNS